MKRTFLAILFCATVAFCQCPGSGKLYSAGNVTACVSIDKREPGKDIPHNGTPGTLVSIVLWTANEDAESFTITVVHESANVTLSRSSEIPHPKRPTPVVDLPVSVTFWLPLETIVKSVSVRENQPALVIRLN